MLGCVHGVYAGIDTIVVKRKHPLRAPASVLPLLTRAAYGGTGNDHAGNGELPHVQPVRGPEFLAHGAPRAAGWGAPAGDEASSAPHAGARVFNIVWCRSTLLYYYIADSHRLISAECWMGNAFLPAER